MEILFRLLVVASILWAGMIIAENWGEIDGIGFLVAFLPTGLLVGVKWAAAAKR